MGLGVRTLGWVNHNASELTDFMGSGCRVGSLGFKVQG